MTNLTNIFLRYLRGLLFWLFLSLVISCGKNEDMVQVKEKPELQTEKLFKILILGDSLTEGYGVDESEAYPTLLQARLNLTLSEKKGKTFKVINGGISGSTTSGGVSRIEWFLKSRPDFLILALGGNDGLRGVPVEQIKTNLEKIILAAQNNQIPILLAGMKIPPNYGKAYNEAFSNLFPTLSDQYDIPLIPFLLEGVGGNPEMNLPDRIHPNPKGHNLICKLVYESLLPVIN